MTITRSFNRDFSDCRPITIDTQIRSHAEGACMITIGNTQLLCTASVDERVPPFLRNSRKGWVTAEYSMLPRATHSRNRREVSNGKPSGRTMEIQRLIGRSLRAAVDMSQLGERQIIVDCDVLQADGGTRTAAITGGYVALALACEQLVNEGYIRHSPITRQIAAISCGIVDGETMIDLDYEEDARADVDANIVMSNNKQLIETQATAEHAPYNRQALNAMLELAETAIERIFAMQNHALSHA